MIPPPRPANEDTPQAHAADDGATACDREPIHQLGFIQPHGLLIATSADWTISQVSANAEHWVGRPAGDLLGTSLRNLVGAEAAQTIRARLSALRGEDAIERAFGVEVFDDGRLFDLAVHLSNDSIIFECQPAEDPDKVRAATLNAAMIERLQQAHSSAELCREAARQLRAMTGFERVMVYKFHPDGSGEVVGEALSDGLDPFMGLRYPASDIPRQARALYERNRLRLVVDVDAERIAIAPTRSTGGEAVDLSMSMLRAVSPIHIEYMRNMGTKASMSVSILAQGQLWGLFACHHAAPCTIGFERRTMAEMFGQMFSLILESRERATEVEYDIRARRLHNKLMAAMAAESSALDNISTLVDVMADLIACDGVGIWVDGQATLSRVTPTEKAFRGLVQFLNGAASSSVYTTNELGRVYPPARDFADRAAGVLAIPISRSPRDCIVFFRREVALSVVWAGNPEKTATEGGDGRLVPRKRFAAWREIVRGQSMPWAEPEIRVADSLRVTVLEIILRLTDNIERERKHAAERQTLLVAELTHRVRNILGVVHGLVGQTKAGVQTVDAFASVLGGRVQALARAHDQIIQQQWEPSSLEALIDVESKAFTSGAHKRIRCAGPDILLQPLACSTLALVLHELVTNSTKYGALSAGHGVVDLAWSLDGRGALVLDWVELGGPPVQVPSRQGFGVRLIERSIPHDLNGTAEINYDVAGLRVRLTIPAQLIASGTPRRPARSIGNPAAIALLTGRVLLVEDNIILALDAEDMLRRIGAPAVDIAGSVDEALRLVAANLPTFAVVNINLGHETGFALASRLRALRIPYCFASGYGDLITLPPEHAQTLVARKPYSVEALAKAIGGTVREPGDPTVPKAETSASAPG